MTSFLIALIEPKILISTLGIFGIIIVIFAETGLLVGFFLPGDSLLFTAGFLASAGLVATSGQTIFGVHFSFIFLLIGTFLAAVIGDSVGYAFGKKVGPSIFTREDSLLFDKKYIVKAQNFYEEHGKKTIILARFIPVIRTFAPIVAGIGSMKYRTFLSYNIIGGFLWTWSLLWLGYGFGSIIPNPDRFIIPVVIVIIIISAIPPIRAIYKNRKGAQ